MRTLPAASHWRSRLIALLASSFSTLVVLSAAAQSPTAFPGAVGFGSAATGGRGGTIYHVTNLNDSGAGSFRDAVSQQNRIIVFDVGGYIVLKSPVSVTSNLTIEGQTAPGQGIGIMAGEVSLSNSTNVIVRGLRIRQGNQDPDTGKSALNMGTGKSIILDHCSFAYGQWDSVDAVGTVNFTVQNSIIADPIFQQFGAHVEVGPSTFYRNLWVNAHNRQPLSKDNTQYINNVIYDYELGYTAANTGGFFLHDLVNNYFITGPMTTTPSDQFFQMNNKQTVYAAGNMLDSTPDGILNGVVNNVVDQAIIVSTPWAPTTLTIPTASATDAYSLVTAGAGAFPRDEVDTFALGDVTSLGTKGQLYKDQGVTGIENDGYGLIVGGTAFADANGDGIPDYWATANGISTTDPAAGTAQYGSSGYTNLEVYANSLILPAPWSAADLNTPAAAGASSFNALTGTWLLTGSGVSAGFGLDQGQFASQAWFTDGNLTAQVTATNGAAGVMVRDGAGAAGAFAAVTVNGGSALFQWRSTSGATAAGVQLSGISLPASVKLVRQSGTLAGYVSTDGVTWRLIGLAQVTLPQQATAGLFLSSGSTTLATAQFTQAAFGTDTGSPVQIQASATSLVYPASLNLTIPVTSSNSTAATGSVKVWDGSTLLTTQTLQGGGTAYWYLQPALSVGTHVLTATYAGDAHNPPGVSAPVTITVSPAPVTLSASCWNQSFAYGSNYQCTANASSGAGAPTGTLEYTYDGSPLSVALSNGSAQWTISTPAVGTHNVTVQYAAQGNFAASSQVSESFAVTAAPVQLQLTPSSYYQSASVPLTLRAVASTWSAPAPASGTVTFYDGSTVLGTVPIVGGSAALTVPSLAAGQHVLTASFSGSTNYSSAASQAATITTY